MPKNKSTKTEKKQCFAFSYERRKKNDFRKKISTFAES